MDERVKHHTIYTPERVLWLLENQPRSKGAGNSSASNGVNWAGAHLDTCLAILSGRKQWVCNTCLLPTSNPQASRGGFAILPSVVGGSVNVPAYLAGHPASMFRVQRSAGRSLGKTIRLGINTSVWHGVSLDALRNRGRAIASAVESLLQAQYNLELTTYRFLPESGELIEFPLYRSGENLDLQRILFMCATPEAKRRIEFLAMECSKVAETVEQTAFGYGTSKLTETTLHGEYDIHFPGVDNTNCEDYETEESSMRTILAIAEMG